MYQLSDHSVTRRAFMKTGISAAGLVGLSTSPYLASASATQPSAFTLAAATSPVQPVSALYITSRSGVCLHPNFNTAGSVYKATNADAIVSRVASMGMTFFRGLLSAQTADAYAAACRKHGIKWLMTVVPEGGTSPTDQTVAATRAKIELIRDKYADVCAGIEGLNEPNHNRGGGTVPSDWARIACDHQVVIWNTAKANLPNGAPSAIRYVPIVGPSLHDVQAQVSYTASSAPGGLKHYHQLAGLGIKAVQNYCGLHTYPGGSYPTRQLNERLSYIYAAYGANYPVWCTEWGYHNALATTAGHKPISEAAAGTYGPRAYLQFITKVEPNGAPRDLVLTFYEMLDDYDSGTKDIHEQNFGLWGVSDQSQDAATQPSSWRPKPIAQKLSALLNALKDPPGTPTYLPPKVVCDVRSTAADASLQWQVTATKAQANAGTATVWLWRDKEVWNRDTARPIVVSSVPVDLTDRAGTRRLTIGAEVVPIPLR